MVSWVVLSDSYVELKVDMLREKLDAVYPGHFLPPQDGSFVIDGPGPGQFFVKSIIPGAAGMFLIISVPGPYTEFPICRGDRGSVGSPQGCGAICCWLSVDLIHKITSDDEAYRFIEQVLAKLAPADAAFLVHPEMRVTLGFDDDIRRRLASGRKFSQIHEQVIRTMGSCETHLSAPP